MNQRVLITGASHGIGKAAAERFAKRRLHFNTQLPTVRRRIVCIRILFEKKLFR